MGANQAPARGQPRQVTAGTPRFIYCQAHPENDGAARCGLPAEMAAWFTIGCHANFGGYLHD